MTQPQQQQQQQSPASLAAVAAARELLGQRLRVKVPDGRLIEGDFQCLDPQGNLILGNAYEQLQAAAEGGSAPPAPAVAATAASAPADPTPSTSGGQQQQPQQPNRPGERALGMVLVPKAQQVETWVVAMPKQRAAIEQMVKEAAEAAGAASGGGGGGAPS
jgi:small nuclear ribonucleoprotein (snRNP)-like protein